jgi:hypothetical protein
MSHSRLFGVVVIVLSAIAFSSVHAFDMAKYQNGGKFSNFLPVINHYNSTGERFPITGSCKSACTMFLSIRSVCVSPGARFYFHAGKGSSGVDSRQTSVMISSYNSALQSYIREHHIMETDEFNMIPGSTIIKLGYPACR